MRSEVIRKELEISGIQDVRSKYKQNDQPSWKNGQHQTPETRPQPQTSRKKWSWTPQETMAMRRCRNRSNDLIHGGRWWWSHRILRNKVFFLIHTGKCLRQCARWLISNASSLCSKVSLFSSRSLGHTFQFLRLRSFSGPQGNLYGRCLPTGQNYFLPLPSQSILSSNSKHFQNKCQ